MVIAGYIEPANEGSLSATYGNLVAPPGATLVPGFPIETDASDMTTGDDHRLYVWYYYAPTSGSQTLTFNDDHSLYWGFAAVNIRGGAVSGNPLADKASTATASRIANTSTTPPVSLELGGANSLVLWVFTDWDGSAPSTPPTGYTYMSSSNNWNGQPMIAAKTYSAPGNTGVVSVASRNGGADNGMTAALLSFRGN